MSDTKSDSNKNPVGGKIFASGPFGNGGGSGPFSLKVVAARLEELDPELGDPRVAYRLPQPVPGPGKKVEVSDDEGEDAKLTLALGVETSFDAFLFNDVDDGRITKPEDGNLHPVLGLGAEDFDDHAWLGYALTGQLKTDLSGGLEALGFKLERSDRTVLRDYRRHDRDQPLIATLVADLEDPRSALDVDDVLGLEVGDAVALEVQGTLAAKVSLEVSDLLASGGSQKLATFLGAEGEIGWELSGGLTIDVGLEVKDAFRVVFGRPADTKKGTLRVVVDKAEKEGRSLSIKAGMNLAFEDSDAVEKHLRGVVGRLLGADEEPEERITELLEASDPDQLGEAERALAEELLERLGLGDLREGFETLRERLGELEKALKTAAKARAELGFRYEYTRLETNETLLRVVVPDEMIKAHHRDLVRQRLGRFLDAVRDDQASRTPKTQVESYLQETTIERTRAFGFSLGIGKWTPLAGKDTERVRWVERENLDQEVQLAFLGGRTYEATWGGEDVLWSVDLRADMLGFSKQPMAADFDFGLHIQLLIEEKEFDGDDLEELVDRAALCGIVPDTEVDRGRCRRRLLPVLGARSRATCQVTLYEDALRRLAEEARSLDHGRFGRALGAALPWREDRETWLSPSRRADVYGPLWEKHLDPEVPVTKQQWRDLVGDDLRKRGYGGEAMLELGASTDNWNFLAIRSLMNPDPLRNRIRESALQFTRGMAFLAELLGAHSMAVDRRKIERCHEQLEELWQQSLYVRALIAQCVEIFASDRNAGSIDDGFERALVVEYEDEASGEDRVIVIPGGSLGRG